MTMIPNTCKKENPIEPKCESCKKLTEERDALLPLIRDLSEESNASINDPATGWNYRRHAVRIMAERAAALKRGDDDKKAE